MSTTNDKSRCAFIQNQSRSICTKSSQYRGHRQFVRPESFQKSFTPHNFPKSIPARQNPGFFLFATKSLSLNNIWTNGSIKCAAIHHDKDKKFQWKKNSKSEQNALAFQVIPDILVLLFFSSCCGHFDLVKMSRANICWVRRFLRCCCRTSLVLPAQVRNPVD